MQKKQIVLSAVFLSLILAASVGIILYPKIRERFFEEEVHEPSPVELMAQDSLPYVEHLKKELRVIEVKKPRKSGREIWRVGKCRTITEHLLLAKRHLEFYQGEIFSMEEIFPSNVFQAATIDFRDFKNDTFHVELQVSREIFQEGCSKMAIVFEGSGLGASLEALDSLQNALLEIEEKLPTLRDSLLKTNRELKKGEGKNSKSEASAEKLQEIISRLKLRIKNDEEKRENLSARIERMQKNYDRAEALIDSLDALSYPHSLLVTPWAVPQERLLRLREDSLRTLVLWLYMESPRMNQTAIHPIRAHFSEEKIADIVRSAFEILPEASGIATRLGHTAVESEKLLSHILSPLKERTETTYFWDLSGVPVSVTKKVCDKLELVCDQVSPYNKDKQSYADYVNAGLKDAVRKGNSVLVLPLENRTFLELKEIETLATQQGTEITTLESLIQLRK